MEIRIVDIIKDLCRENGISIPKLEKEVGLSNGSIYNWNKSYPSIDKVVKVADYFDVSVDRLIGREVPVITMAARKCEGELTADETLLLKRLANLLVSKEIDTLKE